MVRILGSILAGAGLLFVTVFADSNETASSTFVASDNSISFALNIPQDSNSNELYFSFTADATCSWSAVGIGGANKMRDALIFMIYSSANGKNVTVSPRLSYGKEEPSYTNNVTMTVLSGTGISNSTMTLNAKCSNCREWQGGSIDITSTTQDFIFAYGPDGSIKSDSLTAGIRRHDAYGVFQMDLTKAVGSPGVPATALGESTGTKQTRLSNDGDYMSPIHAVMMILSFVILMPLGVIVLRVLNSPKWHGIHQAVSVFIAFIGAILGISVSTSYNRSKSFNTAHQIIGLLVTVGMLGQGVLGFLHHRIYKKTLLPTKLARPHIWLGRIVIPLGIINGFTGFPLALVPKYDWALVIVTLLVVIVLAPVAFCGYKRNARKKKTKAAMPTGYQTEPWTEAGTIPLSQAAYPPAGYPPAAHFPGMAR